MDIEEYTEEEFQLVLKRNIRSLIIRNDLQERW